MRQVFCRWAGDIDQCSVIGQETSGTQNLVWKRKSVCMSLGSNICGHVAYRTDTHIYTPTLYHILCDMCVHLAPSSACAWSGFLLHFGFPFKFVSIVDMYTYIYKDLFNVTRDVIEAMVDESPL
jgi:hypothetical protein